ncbi:cytochrome P450 [Saccharothrix syringae]|uniref:Cytochrome P450 n=1 Tax=Saccharothrix syringae TaxID=103733 RepID=A0A5Q0H212_SACSY|nr:cytochrome P450 [Saccharothrix syringae]QFZ19904.1 cytochrome P450 [Saccharothrix syringae]
MRGTYRSATAPGALPVLGHAWHLATRPVDFLRALPRLGDLVEIRLGPRPAHVCCHPELLRHVLVHDRVFDRGGPAVERIRDVIGDGLATCRHDQHRAQRRLVQPAFRADRMRWYARVMAEEVAGVVGAWRPGQVVDVHPALQALSRRVVVRTLFAEDAPATVHTVQHSVEAVLRGFLPLMLLPPPLRRLLAAVHHPHRRASRSLRHAVDVLVAARRPGGLVDVLAPLPPDQVHSQVLTMLVAAVETTAATMTWCLTRLARHPEVQDRVRAEANRASEPDELPYARRVLNEALRLHHPTLLLTRTVTEPVELAGTTLPRGATVLTSPAVVHLNAADHPRPRLFDPDRWDPALGPLPPRESFVPFGAGARQCIGDAYATTEAVLTLAAITRRWRLSLAPEADLRTTVRGPVPVPRRALIRFDYASA